LFSGALLILASFRRRGALWIACGLFIAVPLAARLAVPTGDSAYWGEHMRKVVGLRLDAIAYGVVAAALWRRMPLALTLWKGPLLALGCALLAAVGVVAQDGPAPWAQAPIFSATSAGFALCLPAAMAMQPPRHRLAAAVRWLSERSYALYIVHLSLIEIGVFHAVRLGMPRNALLPGALIASLAVAELSFRCIERPILRRRPRQFPEPLLAPASALAS
ncbi:MAG: acyltransferase, partial [Alphaproteobacteria bacterium]|nr:acyltransferase [Alphaproteobacteria bacterium]